MFIDALKHRYHLLFGKTWSPWVAGFLLGVTNVFLFAYAKPWTTFDGVLNWGNNILGFLGIYDGEIASPLLYSSSLLNWSLILGATIAALFANEFGLRMAPTLEMIKAVIGGIFMGIGANLAMGCNIGGFFSSVSALSLSGFAMMLGLMVGAFLGIRYLLWETEKLPQRLQPKTASSEEAKKARSKLIQPIVGLIMLTGVIVLALTVDYAYAEHTSWSTFFLFGIFLGIVNQRSRFCFVKAFREPFLTGDGKMTQAVIIALITGVIGFSIVKWTLMETVIDKIYMGVRPTFWIGGLLGGVIFGFGMSLTGGCASGSMWRAGEGHIKLWVALLTFSISGATFQHYLRSNGLAEKLGEAIFFPDILSWKLALIVSLGILSLWSLFVTWNEVKGRFSAL